MKAAVAGSKYVVNDGELLSMTLPLHYRIHPNALAVLARPGTSRLNLRPLAQRRNRDEPGDSND